MFWVSWSNVLFFGWTGFTCSRFSVDHSWWMWMRLVKVEDLNVEEPEGRGARETWASTQVWAGWAGCPRPLAGRKPPIKIMRQFICRGFCGSCPQKRELSQKPASYSHIIVLIIGEFSLPRMDFKLNEMISWKGNIRNLLEGQLACPWNRTSIFNVTIQL